MEIITYVGCGLSLTAEVLTIIAYCTLTWVYKHNLDCVSNCGERQEKGNILAYVIESPLQLLHRSTRWYMNGTLSPMRGISTSLTHSQWTDKIQGTSCLTLFVCGFFNVPHWKYQSVRRDLRFVVLIREEFICYCNYKGSTFCSVILIPWVLVRPEVNSRPPVWYPDAYPTEPPVNFVRSSSPKFG